MDELLDFSQEVAVITGAGSGFGQRLAVSLAQRHCRLVLGDINPEGLDETLSELSRYKDNIRVLKCDVSDEQQCAAMAEKANTDFGKLTLAINNAGIAHPAATVNEITESVFDQQMAVNVKGVMFGMKYQLPSMIKNGGGQILNVSSAAGLLAAPRMGAYAAAKHAVIGLSKTAAIENARFNVRVNAICPSFSPTKILDTEGFQQPGVKEKMAQSNPMKRLADPQEIVNVMVLMLSPKNTYINGQSIVIDGGLSIF